MQTRLRWPLMVVVALLVWIHGRDASAQATRNITGIVVDSEGGAPLTGISVAVKDDPKLVTQMSKIALALGLAQKAIKNVSPPTQLITQRSYAHSA